MVPMAMSGGDDSITHNYPKIIYCDYMQLRMLIYTTSNLRLARKWIVHAYGKDLYCRQKL